MTGSVSLEKPADPQPPGSGSKAGESAESRHPYGGPEGSVVSLQGLQPQLLITKAPDEFQMGAILVVPKLSKSSPTRTSEYLLPLRGAQGGMVAMSCGVPVGPWSRKPTSWVKHRFHFLVMSALIGGFKCKPY